MIECVFYIFDDLTPKHSQIKVYSKNNYSKFNYYVLNNNRVDLYAQLLSRSNFPRGHARIVEDIQPKNKGSLGIDEVK